VLLYSAEIMNAATLVLVSPYQRAPIHNNMYITVEITIARAALVRTRHMQSSNVPVRIIIEVDCDMNPSVTAAGVWPVSNLTVNDHVDKSRCWRPYRIIPSVAAAGTLEKFLTSFSILVLFVGLPEYMLVGSNWTVIAMVALRKVVWILIRLR
jgi:hypothetical protein